MSELTINFRLPNKYNKYSKISKKQPTKSQLDQQLHTKTLRDKANKIIQQNLDREKRLLKRNEQAEINKNIQIMAEQQLLDLQATFEEYKNQTQTFI